MTSLSETFAEAFARTEVSLAQYNAEEIEMLDGIFNSVAMLCVKFCSLPETNPVITAFIRQQIENSALPKELTDNMHTLKYFEPQNMRALLRYKAVREVNSSPEMREACEGIFAMVDAMTEPTVEDAPEYY